MASPLARLRHCRTLHRCAVLAGRCDALGSWGDTYYRPREWLSSALWGAIRAGCCGPDVEWDALNGLDEGRVTVYSGAPACVAHSVPSGSTEHQSTATILNNYNRAES